MSQSISGLKRASSGRMSKGDYEGENRITIDVEKLVRKEVHLIVLNRAKADLADEIIRKGRPIVVQDRGLFLEFLCIISDLIAHVENVHPALGGRLAIVPGTVFILPGS